MSFALNEESMDPAHSKERGHGQEGDRPADQRPQGSCVQNEHHINKNTTVTLNSYNNGYS